MKIPKLIFHGIGEGYVQQWDEPYQVIEESENYYIARYGITPGEVEMPVEVFLKSDCEEASKELYKYWEDYFNDQT